MKTARIARSRWSALGALCMFLGAATACSKADAPAAAKPAESASPASSASASASSAPAGSGAFAASSAKAATGAPTAWSGSYEATPGTMYVPDGGEWSGVKFRGEDASVGLGAGTLTVTVDPTGRAEGTSEGPLGALTVTGLVDGDTFSARLSPADPNDGFTGVALGKRDGASFKGTMHLSRSTGNVIREASFTLAKK